MKKFLAIVLAAVMLCTVFVSCKGKETAETKVKVTVSIFTDDDDICENAEVTVTSTDGKGPYAYDAIIAALDDNEIPYKTELFAGYDRFVEISGNGLTGANGEEYLWELTINGKEAKGRINVAEIKDGDKLVLSRNEYISTLTTEPVTTEPETTEAPVVTADDDYVE